MGSLIELHNAVLAKFMTAREQLRQIEQELADLKSSQGAAIAARMEKLEEQMEKIDEYMQRIDAFRKLAEKNLESQNVPTIEAPPGYRVNLNRLRRWAMMIDPASSNDPYAQRVYVVAKCDSCFLQQKKAEFTQRLEQLRRDQNTGMTMEISRLEGEARRLSEELARIAASEEMMRFAKDVIAENLSGSYDEPPRFYANVWEKGDAVTLGAWAFPLDIPEGQQNIFGKFYDKESRSVWIPASRSTEEEFALSVLCSPARAKQLDKALQNLMLQILERYPAGKHKIYVLDGVRYNSAVLGSLRQLEDSFALAAVPRNPEQLTEALERIVSSFADLDDVLELRDSVLEFNRTANREDQLARTTLVIFGWPQAYSGRDREYLNRIMTNYERYGISFISVSYQEAAKKERDEERSALPEYAAQNAVRIHMLPKETSIRMTGESEGKAFQWYMLGNILNEEYGRSLRANQVERQALGNEYVKRHPEFLEVPKYTRGYQKIELPFGVDSRDKEHSLSFENENFAAYLVGASRSGKSTLLHSLIAGLIRNYHPDNLELWLADFKQLEFKKYMDHCPPHVKYILLDESPELAYDLLDRLTDKMWERQRLFSKLGVERIDQLDPRSLDSPLPVIFVILDEFSIMSQAIGEIGAYCIRLQNLLAKGAALGIKFLFASQTFTKGIRGLTPTARAQIQQRIAMKGTKEEIKETLELSMSLQTEQVRNWMDALPPHYALVKHRIDADSLPQVNRVLTMYFPDYAPLFQLIDRINDSMTKGVEYQVSDPKAYVRKNPVFVDGNSYEAFSEQRVRAGIAREKRMSGYTGDEVYLALGVPRLLTRQKLIPLSRETRENLLLIGRTMEQDCCASVLASAMRSCLLQRMQVRVWAYGKNRLYRKCREGAWKEPPYDGVQYVEDIEQVCDAIRDLHGRIQRKEAGNELILLVGVERICADFEFVDSKGSAGSGVSRPWVKTDPKLAVSTPEQAVRWKMAQDGIPSEDLEAFEAFRKKDPNISKGAQEGASPKEQEKGGTDAAKEEQETAAPEEQGIDAQGERTTSEEGQAAALPEEQGAYNASNDLQYIVMQGSRLGYHFLLFLNSYADLRETKLKPDWFRHRMAFQSPTEDSKDLFHNRSADTLPEHVCLYSDTMSRHSFRPYLHKGIGWDGWEVTEDGRAVNLFD